MTDPTMRVSIAVQTDVGVPRQMNFDVMALDVDFEGNLVLHFDGDERGQVYHYEEWIAWSVQKITAINLGESTPPAEPVVDYGGEFMGRSNITAEHFEEAAADAAGIPPVEEGQEWDGQLNTINAADLVLDENGNIYKDRYGTGKTMDLDSKMDSADLILTSEQIRMTGLTPL